MKNIVFSTGILIFLFLFLFCQKNKEEYKKTTIFAEEVFPGVHGQLQDFMFNGYKITVEKFYDSLYLFEGDIILTKDQLTIGSKKGAGLGLDVYLDVIRKWNCNTIYYTIGPSIQNKKSEILSAIELYKEKTPLKFVEWSRQTNYVEFLSSEGQGIGSNCGMIGGHQFIWLSDSAEFGNVLHEIGHTVGLIHEHSRWDRDSSVKIYPENIQPGKEYQFDKFYNTVQTNNFDFGSVMLYHSYAFSIDKNTLPTITRLDGSTFTVQREKLSDDDIKIINDIYTKDETVKDIDGNVYRTVVIGKQTWMGENLKTTRLNDGTALKLLTKNLYDEPAYCWYDNNETRYKTPYGALYNWEAAGNARLCPTGWHVPGDDEWTRLANYLGGMSVAGGKLKEVGTTHWGGPNSDATNEVCFTALPVGMYDTWVGTFSGQSSGMGLLAFWWSRNFTASVLANYWFLWANDMSLKTSQCDNVYGYSVRCIKD